MFNRGIRLPFRLLGIPLILDWSFLLILPLLVWIIGSQVLGLAQLFGVPRSETLITGWTPYLLGLTAALGLFAGVVLHELGHAVTARAYGVKVRSITLWFLGGIARFEEMPRRRGAEAVVSIVGPLVSFALAGLCWLALAAVPAGAAEAQFVLAYLTYMNVVLAVFNMIPALPLDGGRVLRSLLAIWMPHEQATAISGWISKGFALVIGIGGLLSLNFFLLAVAVFIYLAVSAETTTMRIEQLLHDVPIRRVMNPRVSTIPPEAHVSELFELMWRERHTAFPVVDKRGHVHGIVRIEDAHHVDPATPVGEIMRDVPLVEEESDAADAFRAMTRADMGGVLVVNEQDQLTGIVTKADMIRVMQFRSVAPDFAAGVDRSGLTPTSPDRSTAA